MSTVKKSAVSARYGRQILVDEDGFSYRSINYLPREQQPEVGDRLYLAKRLNNHHGELAHWEIWPITIEEVPGEVPGYDWPKTWYGNGRYVYYRERK